MTIKAQINEEIAIVGDKQEYIANNRHVAVDVEIQVRKLIDNDEKTVHGVAQKVSKTNHDCHQC